MAVVVKKTSSKQISHCKEENSQNIQCLLLGFIFLCRFLTQTFPVHMRVWWMAFGTLGINTQVTLFLSLILATHIRMYVVRMVDGSVCPQSDLLSSAFMLTIHHVPHTHACVFVFRQKQLFTSTLFYMNKYMYMRGLINNHYSPSETTTTKVLKKTREISLLYSRSFL